ncbi:MAG: glycosyltransferase family 39 protein [Anaerolineae bacterium]|nr:glycosyltransferase family 39 protein [Anaerolineae bacterium]
MQKILKLIAGVGFVLLAVLLPVETLKSASPIPDGAETGIALLQFCLAVNGLFLLAWAFAPSSWFQTAGLPMQATGLNIGPEGWAKDFPPISWRSLGLLTAVAAVLRFIGANRDLWLDEIATTVNYLRRPVLENFFVYGSANQHLLYSVFGSATISILGETEVTTRLPAILFGIGSIVGLYLLARLITTEQQALLVSAFMTLSYHHVWFSQNARGYSGMIFAVVWGTYFFAYGLARNRTGAWIGYIITTTVGILFLLNTAFVWIAQGLVYLLILPRWHAWRTQHWPLTRRVTLVMALVALLVAEGYSLALPQLVEWYTQVDRTGLGWDNILEFVPVVLQGLRSGFGGLPPAMLIVGMGAAVTILGAGWLSFWRQSPFIAGLLAFPVIFNFVILMVFQIGAYPRSFLYVLPLALILVVRGGIVLGDLIARHVVPAGRFRPPAQQYLGTAFVVIMIAASAVSVGYNYLYPKQNFTGALAYVDANKRPDDVVSAVGLAGSSYREYYGPSLQFPDDVQELTNLESTGQDVWVLYTLTRDMRLRFSDLFDYIQENYELVAVFPGTLGDGAIYVNRRKSQTTQNQLETASAQS